MATKVERRRLLAPVKNINRVLLIGIVLFITVSMSAGIRTIISNITSNKQQALCLLELVSYAALGLPMFIFSKLHIQGSSDVGCPKFSVKTIKNGVICAVITYPLMLLTVQITGDAGVRSEMDSETLEMSMAEFPIVVNIIRMALIPAIIEEFVFRCGMFSIYAKKSVLAGIFLSAAIFALMHVNLYQIPYAFVSGIAFAYATYVTGNTGVAVIAHCAVNLISIGMSYLNNIILQYCPERMESIERSVSGLIMAGGVMTAGYLFAQIMKKTIEPKTLKIKGIENTLSVGSLVTLPLVFVIAILTLLTLLYEGLATV